MQVSGTVAKGLPRCKLPVESHWEDLGRRGFGGSLRRWLWKTAPHEIQKQEASCSMSQRGTLNIWMSLLCGPHFPLEEKGECQRTCGPLSGRLERSQGGWWGQGVLPFLQGLIKAQSSRYSQPLLSLFSFLSLLRNHTRNLFVFFLIESSHQSFTQPFF